MYARTTTLFSRRILEHYPDVLEKMAQADKELFKKGEWHEDQFPAYLMWILEELQTFSDLENAMEWLAWVQRSLEMMGHTTLQEAREHIQADRQERLANGEYPKFLMCINGKERYLTLEAAAMAFGSDLDEVKIADTALDIRPITEEEKQAIIETAEERN